MSGIFEQVDFRMDELKENESFLKTAESMAGVYAFAVKGEVIQNADGFEEIKITALVDGNYARTVTDKVGIKVLTALDYAVNAPQLKDHTLAVTLSALFKSILQGGESVKEKMAEGEINERLEEADASTVSGSNQGAQHDLGSGHQASDLPKPGNA